MKTLYELLNIDLAQAYTKARKLAVLNTIEHYADLKKEAEAAIAEMEIPEDDDRHHWIHFIAAKAASDLLTIGKVQPEHMLEMSGLSKEDFSECVKVATMTARSLNNYTVAAEKDLNIDTINDEIV